MLISPLLRKVAWTDEELRQLPLIVAQAHKNKCYNVREISRTELFHWEPNISRHALGAVFIDGECVVDSWIPCIAFLHQAINNGGKLLLNSEVVSGKFVCLRLCSPVTTELRYWELRTRQNQLINARIVINCAGTHADIVETTVRGVSEPRFTIQPRKGQFVVLKAPNPHEKSILSHMILPVPTERTKGIIVYPSVYGNIVIGPTAEDQSERDVATTDDKTIKMLLEKGRRIYPQLNIEQTNVVGTYAGIRPATQFKDYIIDVARHDHWCTVAGIRSTGLSAALGISAYVLKLLLENFTFLQEKCNILLEESGQLPEVPNDIQFKCWPQITPFLKEFIKVDKTIYKVGHPLTIFGWQNLSDEHFSRRNAKL
jgi:glycerol-3-phosphate dehydrogenase